MYFFPKKTLNIDYFS